MSNQHRTRSRSRIAPALRPLTAAVLLALAAGAGAQSLPTGFAVDVGTVSTPTINGTTMDINQGSQNAIINWQTFSIGDGYTVNFNQPGVTSIAINRVLGDSASNIFGNLNSNGNIFLINTNGVLFGANAQVNVGGLVASALDLESADFDNGVFVFAGGGGGVTNEGRIVAGDRGTVALLGEEVTNAATGSIIVPRGSIALGAGERITLDFEGDGLTQMVLDGEFTDGQVTNAGLLQADGGNVTLAAIADGDGDGLSILHTGIIRANTLENRQGRVVLSAGNDIVVSGGTIDVSGREAGELGGSIDIQGENVLIDAPPVTVTFAPPPPPGAAVPVDNPAHLDASGVAGGGSIRIDAGNVVVVTETRGLDASATGNGDGGRVELSGTNGARIFGDLRARGGAGGGNGGFIETSGGGVDLRGIGIDTSAANGDAGTWLIDPFDVDIISGTGAGTLPANPFEPVATSVIQDGDINNALDAGSSVRITTGDPGAGNPGDGNITIFEGVQIVRSVGTAPLTFQLDANRAIFGQDFSIDGGTGPLDVLFNANANNTADPTGEDAGIVLLQAQINTRGGDFWLYGQGDPVAGFAGGEEEGVTLDVVDVDTRDAAGNGGEIRLRGRGGNSGVEVIDSSLLSGSGDIHVFGSTVFSGTAVLIGDFDNDGRTLLQTTGGDIDITGLALEFFGGTTFGSDQVGVDISDASILADGGNIDVRGRAAGDVDPTVLTTAIGVRLGNTAEVGNALTANTRLVGESVDAGNFQSGLEIESGCGNDGACVGGDVVVLQAGTSDGSQALYIDGTVQGESLVNLRPGGVDANGLAYDRTGDAITLGAGAGFALDAGDLANITTPDLVLGSDTHAGLIQVQGAVARAGNLTLQNAGAGAAGIVLGAAVDVGTLALVSGSDITQTAPGSITADSLLARSTGGDVLLSTATNNVSGNTLAGDAAGDFSYTDADALAIGTVTATGFSATTGGTQALAATGVGAGADVFVRNLTGDLVLDAGATAGNDIDLVTAGRLQNLAGATLTAGNTWRVWADTWIGETRGGLAGSGTLPNLYNCTFAGTCGVTVPAAGNHFIYAAQPTATITIGDALREYGLDNPAFTFTVAGMILGDIAGNAITGEPGTVATILSNVGDYPITGAFDSPAGYAINLLPGTLTIDPATLTFIADPFTRIYGDPNGTLGGTVTGFRNGEDLGSATEGTLTFTSTADEFSDVGTYAIVGGGLSAGNYVFVQDPGNATALTIDPATLTYIADPFSRLVGQPNGVFTGIVTGFRNGEDLGSATEGTLTFTSTADEFSPVGVYEINGGGLEAGNYVFVQDPGNATALTVFGPVGSVFPPDIIRDPPDNYVYNGNLGSPQMCALVDVLAGTQGREGDSLAREWSRVRSRPNLASCVQTDRRNGCADF